MQSPVNKGLVAFEIFKIDKIFRKIWPLEFVYYNEETVNCNNTLLTWEQFPLKSTGHRKIHKVCTRESY